MRSAWTKYRFSLHDTKCSLTYLKQGVLKPDEVKGHWWPFPVNKMLRASHQSELSLWKTHTYVCVSPLRVSFMWKYLVDFYSQDHNKLLLQSGMKADSIHSYFKVQVPKYLNWNSHAQSHVDIQRSHSSQWESCHRSSYTAHRVSVSTSACP